MLSQEGRGGSEYERQSGSSGVKVGVVTTVRKCDQLETSLAACWLRC